MVFVELPEYVKDVYIMVIITIITSRNYNQQIQ